MRRCRFLRGLRYPLMQGSQLYPLMQGSQLGVSTKSAPENGPAQGEAGQDGVGGLPVGVARIPLVSHLSASFLTESAWWRKPRNSIVPCTRKQGAPGAQTYMHTGSKHTCLEE